MSPTSVTSQNPMRQHGAARAVRVEHVSRLVGRQVPFCCLAAMRLAAMRFPFMKFLAKHVTNSPKSRLFNMRHNLVWRIGPIILGGILWGPCFAD